MLTCLAVAFWRGAADHQQRTLFFFFNDTATTEIYTLSLHDALPISEITIRHCPRASCSRSHLHFKTRRSEEHTSELQSRSDLVCRLLLEKKKTKRCLHLYPNPDLTPIQLIQRVRRAAFLY